MYVAISLVPRLTPTCAYMEDGMFRYGRWHVYLTQLYLTDEQPVDVLTGEIKPILVSDTMNVVLDSVLALEEKEQLCVLRLLTVPSRVLRLVVPGEPILAEGTLKV